MADRDRYRVELDVNAGQQSERAAPLPDTPFNIGILGDFRGAGAGALTSDWQPFHVDRDDIDEVMARVGPALRFSVTGGESGEIALRFSELEHFHPDRLLSRVPALKSIWELRRRLADPRSFAAAARELSGADPSTTAPAPAAPRAKSSGNLLEDMLADVPGPALEPVAAREDDLQDLVRRVVAPHVVADRDPRQDVLVAQVDALLADALRALLHFPAFQALESLWRGVDFITRRLDTDSSLRVYLVDVSRAALSAEQGSDRLQRFAAAGIDGEPWAVLAGCYTFGPAAEDAALLSQLARAASAAGVPFLAAGDVRTAGCPRVALLAEPEEWGAPANGPWSELRRSAEAASVSLIAPRFLLRLPYGKDEPCELLRFEENPDAEHGRFLWGNPAVAGALLLGESFQRAGWQLRPGMVTNIDGLPMHFIRRPGDTSVLPCAEALMSERAANRLIEQGISPLASLKEQDSVRLVRLQSLSGRSLAGPWN